MTTEELETLTSGEQQALKSRVQSAFAQFNGDGVTSIFGTGWSSSLTGLDGATITHDQLDDKPEAKFMTPREIYQATGQTPPATGVLRWSVSFLRDDQSRRGGNAKNGWCVRFQARLTINGEERIAEKKICGGPAGAGFREAWDHFPND